MMNILNKTLLALLATSAVSMGANAALTYNETGTTHNRFGYAGQPYIGIKAGQSNIDLNTNTIDNDKSTAFGVYGGYQIDPNWGAEVEYVGSSKEDVKVGSTKIGEVKQHTIGAYGTYKYTFPNTNLYAKGKLGLAQNKVEVNGANGYTDSDGSKTSLAGGLGLGYNLTPMAAVEVEYEKLPTAKDVVGNNDADTDLVTVGAHLKF